METITEKDFGQEPITESGYFLFRNKRTKSIRVAQVDTIFDSIEFAGEASVNLQDRAFTEAREYLVRTYDWYRIPVTYRD